MHGLLLAIHVTSAALVVGSLFLQSLVVVMALRLAEPAQREGVRLIQRRVHLFIYYPILLVALLTGLWLALDGDWFGAGRWLHWKLVFVVVLIGLGLLTGQGIRRERVVKPVAMIVHVLVFLVSLCIVYLAVLKPY